MCYIDRRRPRTHTVPVPEDFLPVHFYIVIPLVTMLAFFIKGATGFGTALVMVPIATLLLGIHDAVVLSTILDIVGGAVLFFRNPHPHGRAFWAPLAAAMVAGSVVGSVILGFVPVSGFEYVLGAVILVLGAWFLGGRGGRDESTLTIVPPERASPLDLGVSAFSGLCGGLFGISGPPIVYYLGGRLAKHAFRNTLVAVFLFGSTARLVTYTSVGLMGMRSAVLSLASIPALLLGLYLGNHLFFRIREIWFSRLVGAVLVLTAVRILFG